MKMLYLLISALVFGACAQQPKTAVALDDETLAGPVPEPTRPAVIAAASATSVIEPVDLPSDSLASRDDVQAFIQEMVTEHGFDPRALSALFAQAEIRSDIIDLMNRPAEAKPWYAYRGIFLTPARVQGGVAFWHRNIDALNRAEEVYGVPAEIIVSIIGVETAYGGNTGSHRVLDALATLAFEYPRRATFFRKELKNYLLLTREEGIDPLALKGSYAGAMGLGQFMPSSYRAYAVDFNGDRQRDLWTNPKDAIGSVANYLAEHRWRRGEPIATPARINGTGYRDLVSNKLTKPNHKVQTLRQRGVIPQAPVDGDQAAMLLEFEMRDGSQYWLGFDNFYVITRYNHSSLYAMAVYQLSQEIRQRKG